MPMPSQFTKSKTRLEERIQGHITSVRNDGANGKGYRKPGSMNRHKPFPLGKPTKKGR